MKKAWKPKKSYFELRARSKRLEAHPYQLSDFAAWRAGHGERREKQHRFDGDKPKPSEITLAAFRKFIERNRRAAKAQTNFRFGIFERKTGRVVGHMGFTAGPSIGGPLSSAPPNVLHAELRWANLGYSIHNQFWGKGYGPEGARLVLGMGFGPIDFHRIEASCELGNKPSAKTALRAGLRKEGLRKKFFSHSGGVDMLVFAQNQLDWRSSGRQSRSATPLDWRRRARK